jgi:hypothetical protein
MFNPYRILDLDFWIPDAGSTGVKKARIPDPDPHH